MPCPLLLLLLLPLLLLPLLLLLVSLWLAVSLVLLLLLSFLPTRMSLLLLPAGSAATPVVVESSSALAVPTVAPAASAEASATTAKFIMSRPMAGGSFTTWASHGRSERYPAWTACVSEVGLEHRLVSQIASRHLIQKLHYVVRQQPALPGAGSLLHSRSLAQCCVPPPFSIDEHRLQSTSFRNVPCSLQDPLVNAQHAHPAWGEQHRPRTLAIG